MYWHLSPAGGKMDKLIIGAGLYGLYAALYCGKKDNR